MLKKWMLGATGVILAALSACSSSDNAPEAATEVMLSAEGRPLTKGKPPGDAFIIHLSDGFDQETQYLSDYNFDASWMATGFAPDNVRFVGDGMELRLVKRQIGKNPYTGGEFQRRGFYGYGRYETIMRGVEGQGVVGAFFTHTHAQFDDDPHDEIDFEYMGKNTRQVHLNHFKNGKPAGSTYIDLPFDFTDGEHLYAFEWEPDAIRWYIDHKLVHEAHDNIPDHSGRVIASLIAFGEGSWDWTGKPVFDDQKVSFYRCMSHVPLGDTSRQCSDYYPIGD